MIHYHFLHDSTSPLCYNAFCQEELHPLNTSLSFLNGSPGCAWLGDLLFLESGVMVAASPLLGIFWMGNDRYWFIKWVRQATPTNS